MMAILLNTYRVATNVTGLGWGRRLTVWTQGCDRAVKCQGCCSPDSWSIGTRRDLDPETVVAWAAQAGTPDGLTLSGGEPVLQAAAVQVLIARFRDAWPAADVLLYTSLSLPAMRRRAPALAEACDAVFTGPYCRVLPAKPLRGRSNQPLHLLTALARARYYAVDSWPMRSQMRLLDGSMITIGIPDMAAIGAATRHFAQE